MDYMKCMHVCLPIGKTVKWTRSARAYERGTRRMRKRQAHQILELLQTIGQAQSAGMYAECGEGARAVSGFIDGIAGEGTRLAAMLLEYCEMLHTANLGGGGYSQAEAKWDAIAESAADVLQPTRLEIAFLTYNASMSDSIESIYLAAKADPDCDAFWVPIPYYERGRDGALGKMVYEGAEKYPADRECTDWRLYDLEARRPDVIVTFAPYDAGNFVTSVHPDFYCERLRKLTDLLIYVPYFVTDDGEIDHFATIAGCIHAHKVIVQSERIRKTYIHAFREAYGGRFGNPEDKFVALGSPKFDKVLNARREDYPLPQAWAARIGGRKALLYNTSIATMLDGNERYLQNLKLVLRTFKQQNEVVLWWRPHPLSEATYQAMRPQLAGEYRQIVAEFKREEYGIYDDSPDLHRAIVWTDGYYGDGSSLIPMYRISAKPLALQCPQRLLFENMLNDESCLWITELLSNKLYSIDKETRRAALVGAFPGENAFGCRLFTSMAMNNGKLYFAPFAAEAVAVVDTATHTFERIALDYNMVANSQCYHAQMKFYTAVAYEQYVYFIPFSFPAIVRYDTISGTVAYYTDWVAGLESYAKGSQRYYFRSAAVVGKHIYAASVNTNIVLVFDTESNRSTILTVGPDGNGFSSICYDGRFFWLAPQRGNELVKWDAETNLAVVRCLPTHGSPKPEIEYSGAILHGNRLFVLPCGDRHIVEINVENGNEKELVFEMSADDVPRRYSIAVTDGEWMYAFESRLCRLLAYKQETMACRVDELYPDTAATQSTHLQASAFIEALAGTACQEQINIDSDNAHGDGTAGQAIYGFAKEITLG